MKRQPKQNGGDAPTEDGEDMPTRPNYADVTLAEQLSSVCWHQAALPEPTEDEPLAEDGMCETDEECQYRCGDEIGIHVVTLVENGDSLRRLTLALPSTQHSPRSGNSMLCVCAEQPVSHRLRCPKSGATLQQKNSKPLQLSQWQKTTNSFCLIYRLQQPEQQAK